MCLIWTTSIFANENTIYLGEPQKSKKGTMPACTPLHAKESRWKVTLRDTNKSWPKFRLDIEDYKQLAKFSDFSACFLVIIFPT
mgnify:CR=1 FL=1